MYRLSLLSVPLVPSSAFLAYLLVANAAWGIPLAPSVIVATHQVYEDGTIPIELTVLRNEDLSEPVLTRITLRAIPTSWHTTTNGGAFNLAQGVWTRIFSEASFTGGPILMPPPDDDQDLQLTVEVRNFNSSDGTSAGVDDVFSIVVDAVADAPLLTVQGSSGAAGTPLPFVIDPTLVDTDGSEIISQVVVSGIPSGGVLSAGTPISQGVFSIPPSLLENLTFTPPVTLAGTVELTVEAFTLEAFKSGLDFDTTNDVASTSMIAAFQVESASFVAVPEPGSIFLLLGAALVLARRRLRRGAIRPF